MTPDELLAALDPEQRAVARALHGPVRVLAGAGTGKTRAITHRIAYGVAAGVYVPTETLAVTFTTRAAGEMRGRLRALGATGVQARTFHSAALRQVRWFWPKVYGGQPPALIESKLGLVGGAARRNRVDTAASTLRDLASEIEWSKVTNVMPNDYARLARSHGREVSGVDLDTVAHVFGTYEELKREQGRMDMEDVLLCAVALLTDDERAAAEVRRQYKRFVVDEFQDVNPVQLTLLDLWLGGRDDICVVGDPAQTIYSFAGARASYLTDFGQRYPDATQVELVRNYRSTPQVVAAANQLLAGTPSAGVKLVAQSDGGPDLSWHEASDEVAEADHVAGAIKRLIDDGTSPKGIAILVRINAQTETFEEALTARQIPYVLRGAMRFFERAEVKQAIALLRAQARSADEVAAGDLAGTVRDVLAGMGWSGQAPTTRGQARDKWESLQALLTQAEEYASRGQAQSDDILPTRGAESAPSLTGFVAELDRRAHEQHAPIADGVTIATLHAAKGLEWDAVFLPGLVDGTMPITYANTPAEVEEERRLLYVGVTRARRALALSWALARSPGGQARRKPSRFLTGLRPVTHRDYGGAEARKPKSTGKSARRAATCKRCRAPLADARSRNRGYCADCPVPYDESVLEALKAWRKEQAASESVPAFVVFSDATLEAVAELQPSDRGGLLRVNGIGRQKLDKYADSILAILKSSKKTLEK